MLYTLVLTIKALIKMLAVGLVLWAVVEVVHWAWLKI